MVEEGKRKTGIMFGSRMSTIWVDARTGQGVTSDGAAVRPVIRGQRKNPNLTDLLDTAANYGARRIMLTGRAPEPTPGTRHWLLVNTPGWANTGSHTQQPIAGRFEHEKTKFKTEVRTAAEWFGDLDLSPKQAREAWDLTQSFIQRIDDRQHLLMTPSRTGLSLWWLSLPRDSQSRTRGPKGNGGGNLRIPPSIPDDIDADLSNVRGQHHIEHLVAGDYASKHDDCVPMIDPAKTPRIDRFTYVDGRFMYASLGRELGVGPGIRLNRAESWELLQDKDGQYARAVFQIRFTVPENWNHIGIFGVKHENVRDGWFFPNRPGATHVTWADAAEVFVGLQYGWIIDPLQGIVFNRKARPMDVYMKRIDDLRSAAAGDESIPRMLRHAIVGALRNILIQSVGALASRGTTRTVVVDSAFDVPQEAQGTVNPFGSRITYQESGDRQHRENYHPELAIQVWGRGRARLLSSPSGFGNHTAGALHLPPETLLGVNGDAIYTTAIPAWAIPEAHGGGDDGRTGRLRLKGIVEGNYLTPDTIARRDRLRKACEKAGPSLAWKPREA